VETRLSTPFQTGHSAHPASCTKGTGSCSREDSGQSVALSIHTLLVPRICVGTEIPLPPLLPICVFTTCYRMIFRVSHELRSLLRESVPYVKIYRYNPKHLCPRLNGYGDNGQRKVWTSWGCMHYTCQLAVIYVRPWVGCHVTECTVSHVSEASHVTSAFGIPVSCIVLRTLRITLTRVRMFLYFNWMALCHSQVTSMLSTDINITETTYSCQF